MLKTIFAIGILTHTIFTCHALASDDTLYFEGRANEGCYPYPSQLPIYRSDKGEHFDWKKYIAEATSEADRAYRAALAGAYFPSNVEGSGNSASDEMLRARFAANEYRNKCNELIEKYRARLKRNHPSMLKPFNEYVSLREKAMDLEVKFEAGSWEGGSGARVAYPAARASALISFFKDLSGLGSNYLQE